MIAHEFGLGDFKAAIATSFGRQGRNVGAFENVRGAAAVEVQRERAIETLVAVSDAGNHRVQIIRPSDGHVVRVLGGDESRALTVRVG